MDSPDQSAAPLATTAEVLYRCKVCGIESPETTCFAAIATDGAYRLHGTCITCNEPHSVKETWRHFVIWIVSIAVPAGYLVATRGTDQVGFLGLLLASGVIELLIIVLHEMGHAFAAKAVGLKVSVMILGRGQLWWAGKLLGLPVRLYAWPSMGLTQLGGRPARFIRARIWLTTLMGPVTNLCLMAAAILFWNALGKVVDSNITLLWIAHNAFMAAANLWPSQSTRAGRLYPTDGMQLLQIPFRNADELAEGLAMGDAGAILTTYNDGDYETARQICIIALERSPGNAGLTILLSACQVHLGDYESARSTIEPLIDTETLGSPLQAAAANNTAVALWLRDFNRPLRAKSLSRADALTAMVYTKYPCVLAYRSTRAMLLADTDRVQEALALLEYVNYGHGNSESLSHREIARAFALRKLGRRAEADKALSDALEHQKSQLPLLRTIGLIQ